MKLTRFRSVPFLRIGQSNSAGRNANGQITVRHRGGGHKQAERLIDWRRRSGQGLVVGYEYDPQRNSNLLKLYHPSARQFDYSYIVAPKGVKLFQELNYFENEVSSEIKDDSSTAKLLGAGDAAPLSFFEPGDFVHNVEAFPGQGPRFARAAGTFCQVRSQSSSGDSQAQQNWAKLRLPSGSQRLFSQGANATLGVVSEAIVNREVVRKAGRSRWLGWRPSVRGVARNPVDHPHGGGEGKTSGGRPSVTFKARPTKGQPTRKNKRKNALILSPRKG